jgi:hypothetical protein
MPSIFTWKASSPYRHTLPPKPPPLVIRDPNPQLSSPLYNGRIPPEIRDMILNYALTETLLYSYPPNTDYTRPSHLGKYKIHTALLRTCKRAYLDCAHLPARNKRHVFWHFAGPTDIARGNGDQESYFRRFTPAQLAQVKEVQLFTQQFWLDGRLGQVCRLGCMQAVERLRITLRRGDWWSVENNAPMAITPHRAWADEGRMRADWRAQEEGCSVRWEEGCWGLAFREMRGLRVLEMELETFEYKKDELDEIVRHAVLWKFPMGEGRCLSAGGEEVGVRRWRGPMCGWSNRCYKCEGLDMDCKHCEEIKALKAEGKGPMLIVKSLRWKLAPA